MKKKYFAKYLPVKGEIKQGDKAQYKTGEIISYDVEINRDNLKKVELFLCTKNIQVGDSVFLQKIREYHRVFDIINNTIHCTSQNGISHAEEKIENCLKIIGKISKDDMWVKEGDDFYDWELDKYPHLFKELHWTEHRDPNDFLPSTEEEYNKQNN